MKKTVCSHLDQIQNGVKPQSEGCQECLATGGSWVQLRMCLKCGHVGCCDSSPGRHATGHFQATGHPLMRSAEPGGHWTWCYIDEIYVEEEEARIA